MDSNQLRNGLGQLLRSYGGAGLKRFDRSSASPLSAQSLARLSAWIDARSTNAAEQARSAHAGPTELQQPSRELSGAVHSHLNDSGEGSMAMTDAQATLALATQSSAPTRAVAAQAVVQPTAPFTGRWQRLPVSLEERTQKLLELDAQVKDCRKCEELVCYRRQTVFGDGNLRPRVCFYGEAPGADEDAQGKPFVGASGKLLGDIIRAMKLTREDVYIMNSLKCRPPQNRTPLPEEVENCRPYALAQLELLQPEFIILLGAVAVRSVLQSTEPVGRLRGRFHHFHGARVLVTYHPAYLLRNAEAKKLVWADVQLVMRELGTIS